MSYWPSNYDYLEVMRMNETNSATPKPRAGEHSTDPMLNDLINIKAERDLLRELERELVEALEKIASWHSAFDDDVVSIAYKALAKVQLKKLKDAP